MVTNKYELMVILDPELSDEDRQALLDRIQNYFAEAKATVFSFKEWRRRRLAYTIKGAKEGLYYLSHFAMDTQAVAQFERSLLLNEGILRQLVTRLEGDVIIEEPQAPPEISPEPAPEAPQEVVEEVEAEEVEATEDNENEA